MHVSHLIGADGLCWNSLAQAGDHKARLPGPLISETKS
jgi:hypothetical protein